VITHRIIKFKPKIVVPPRHNMHGGKDSPIKNTQDLLAYVKDLHPQGAYITLKYNTTITNVGAINYVMAVAQEYADNLFTFRGSIEAHQVLNLNTQMSPWIRWVDATDYRVLTDEERQVWLDANVSNYIKDTLESI
jgi:hypothetical protein